MLSEKWLFNKSQDWKLLRDNFDSVSLDKIPDGTLKVLDFHFSTLSYLEKKALRFVDITDNPDLTIKPVDNGQPITDSKDKKMKKQNKHAAKKKAQLDNLHAPVRASAAGSATFLLSWLASISCSKSATSLSSRSGSLTCLSPLPTCLETPTTLLSCSMPAPILGFLVVLLHFPMLGLVPPYLISIAFKTFKQSLSDKFLRRNSTNPAELFCLFPLFGSFSNKTDCKRTFDITFINSCPLASNYAQEKIDLSFAECNYPAVVKPNQLWQLKLLDSKPISIMEAIPLVAAIF